MTDRTLRPAGRTPRAASTTVTISPLPTARLARGTKTVSVPGSSAPAHRPRPTADHGSAAVAVIIAAAVILFLAALADGIAGVTGQQAAACTTQPAASTTATAIPARYLTDYKNAGTAYQIPWTVLAGIGTVESDNGQSTAPGVHSGTNPDGAAGPMQFGVTGKAGDTWGGAPIHPATQHTTGYGTDGDHNGITDVYDPGDAIPSAARFLQAHGAPATLQAAIFAYNHSAAYVTDVLNWAARYATAGTRAVATASSALCQQAALGPLPPAAAGKVIAYAEAQLGKPYQWGATGPAAFDCSGLTMMAYRAAGIFIPRTSQQQWAFGRQTPASRATPGDLVFFAGSDGTMTTPGHVGIVIPGHDMMIDAPRTGRTVTTQSFAGSTDLVGFTRP